MGRKLTYYERAERERGRERERVRKAKAVAQRRSKARAEKEKKLKSNITTAKKEVGKYEKFYDSLVNLHLHSFAKNTFHNSFSKGEEFSTNLKKPRKPGPFKFKPNRFIFKQNDELKTLKNEAEYEFKEYCNAEGKFSFILFVKLFGTEEKYETFKEQKRQQYNELNKKKEAGNKTHKEKEEERKIVEQKEYDASVTAFESGLKAYEKKLVDQKTKFADAEEMRKNWLKELLEGDKKSMEEACEVMFPIEFSFDDDYVISDPTESTVGYKIASAEKVEVCINLPSELNFLPEYGLKMTRSGRSASKFKISQKLSTEAADRVICSIAFSYLKSIYNILKTVNEVFIEVGTAGIDPKTGGVADIIFLSMNVSKDTYTKLKLSAIDVLHAIENFDHQYRSSRTKKNIDSKINREEVVWATDDDKNIKLNKHLINSFRANFYDVARWFIEGGIKYYH